MLTQTIVFLVTAAVMLAVYGVARGRGSIVLWGGQEKAGRIKGARVTIESHEDQPPLPVEMLTGTIIGFDGPSNSYEVRLDDELRVTGVAQTSVRIRSANPGQPLSAAQGDRRYPPSIDVWMEGAGWLPATASIGRNSTQRRRLGVLFQVVAVLAGSALLAYGMLCVHRNLRIQDHGKTRQVVVQSATDTQGHRICYWLYVEASDSFHGPDMFSREPGCVGVSRELYEQYRAGKPILARYDPDHPAFNRITPISVLEYWAAGVAMAGGLLLGLYGVFLARRWPVGE
jgi:uncharacterized protein DUF3592